MGYGGVSVLLSCGTERLCESVTQLPSWCTACLSGTVTQSWLIVQSLPHMGSKATEQDALDKVVLFLAKRDGIDKVCADQPPLHLHPQACSWDVC